MGEVFRARDTRLGRTVALKLTAGPDSDDPQHRLRLEREARAIAALNHPHICAIHDVGRDDGRDYLVMEYIEGETLERRLERGRLPMTELLRAATEIASALDAAHRAGITHRDLKPANVMLTRGGVKLLDFGVARQRPIADGSGTDQVTTVLATTDGALVGTLPYMAPEQLEGRAVDGRTDIFAFGAVLFEMATGQRAFAGTSAAGLAAAILGESRPRLPEATGLPPALGRVISTCLARDSDDRFQNAGDLLRALKWIGEDAADTRTAARDRPPGPRPHFNVIHGASETGPFGQRCAAIRGYRTASAARSRIKWRPGR
jgi:serine/threonine protein kinase